jgi:hypothetical protein
MDTYTVQYFRVIVIYWRPVGRDFLLVVGISPILDNPTEVLINFASLSNRNEL